MNEEELESTNVRRTYKNEADEHEKTSSTYDIKDEENNSNTPKKE